MATSGSQQNSVNNCRIMDQSTSPSSASAGVSALRHLQNLQQLQHLHQLHHLHSIHKRSPHTASSSPSSSPSSLTTSQCMDQTRSWHPHVYRPKQLTSHLIVDILFPDKGNNNNKTGGGIDNNGDDDDEDREKKCRQSVSGSVVPSTATHSFSPSSSSSSSCCNTSSMDPLTSLTSDQTVCNLLLKSAEAGKQESGSADVLVPKHEGPAATPSEVRTWQQLLRPRVIPECGLCVSVCCSLRSCLRHARLPADERKCRLLAEKTDTVRELNGSGEGSGSVISCGIAVPVCCFTAHSRQKGKHV